MSIPKNLEEVGYNQATVNMDVDALVRESMIRLFNLTDNNGNKLGDYDELYDEMKKVNTGLDPDNSGAASMVKQFVLLEGKILGFLFQQFLSMVKPIQTALELPQILANPASLVRKIKDIIDNIKKLIEDVISFFTETLNWFLDLLIGEIMDVNIPIPPLEFSILGITIPIPSIDNLDKFGKEPFLEDLTDNVNKIKERIASNRERIKNLVDKINPDIESYQVGMVGLLTAQISKLYSVDYEITKEFYDKAYQIHTEVILEKNYIVQSELGMIRESITKKIFLEINEETRNSLIAEKNTYYYKFDDKTSDLESLKSYLDENIEEENYISVYTGDEDTLLNMPDNIIELIESEEKDLEDTINNYGMENNEELKNKFDTLDEKLIVYTEELLELRDELVSILRDIEQSEVDRQKIYDNERDMLAAGGAAAAAATIQELKDAIKLDTKSLAEESPASAWIESMIDLVIGIIKSPIDMIINLISKIIEGILEFIKQLPLPKFTLIKEFFADLLGLANPEKMDDVIAKLIIDISGASDDFLPVIENIVSFLPWLFVEIAKTFVTSVVEPLPIPI